MTARALQTPAPSTKRVARRLSQRGPRIVLQVMTHTPPTSTTATPRDDARTPQPPRPTFGEMLEELIDLSVGLGVAAAAPALARRARDRPLRRPAGHPAARAGGAAGRDRRGDRRAAVPAGALAAATPAADRRAPGRPCRQRAAIGQDERSVAGPGSRSRLNARESDDVLAHREPKSMIASTRPDAAKAKTETRRLP